MKTFMMVLTSLYVMGYALPKKISEDYAALIGVDKVYCVASAGGHNVVICEGNTITEDVTLQNGKILKPDGTIVSKDGTRTQMQPGECIGSDGKMTRRGKDKNPKTKY